MPRGTGFRGPLFFSAPNLPFDGIPLDVANQTFNRQHVSAVLGGASYNGPLAAGTDSGWVMTNIAGTGAVTVGNDGAFVLTTSTTDEDRTQLQYKLAQFKYSTTLNLSCFARLKVSTAATTDAFFGLASVDTTVVTAAAGAVDVDDGIFFFKTATATDWTVTVIKDTTSTTATTGLTIANDTYMIIGFTIVKGVIKWYAVSDSNDKFASPEACIGSPSFLGNGTAIANTNAPDDTDLCLTVIAGQEGGTTARVLTVDWAFAVQNTVA